MNCFEKRIKTSKILGITGCIILPFCIAAAIITGVLTDPYSAWFILPVFLCIFSIFPIILGFTFKYTYSLLYRTAKTLFTEAEIREIDKPFFMNAAIAEKAKRLLAKGKASGDMTEYNEFRELVMLTRPAGYYGRYGNFGF